MFYFLPFSLLILLRYTLKGQVKLRNQLYPPVLFALFLFSAFRFEVGCDWTGYLNQFQVQQSSTMIHALATGEPLWWGIMELIDRFGLPYPWLNIVSSAIFFGGIHVLARRQPDPLGFLILLFPILIVGMPMSGIRQGAAIGIMSIAFVAFLDKRLFRFVVLTVLASTLHNSAMVLLLLAPLVSGAYTKTRLALTALLAILGMLLMLGGDAADLAIARYVDTATDAYGAAYRVGLLLVAGIFFFLVLRKKWARIFPGDYRLISVGSLIMLAMLLLVPVSSVIADRFGYYLIPIQAMIFARIPYFRLGPSQAIYSAAPYLGLALVFLVWTSLSWHFQLCYQPYGTWLFGFPQNASYLF